MHIYLFDLKTDNGRLRNPTPAFLMDMGVSPCKWSTYKKLHRGCTEF